MPTSFAAFTFRDGIPRRIPDRGTHWHLGKEVKKPIRGEGTAWQHPELDKPKPAPTLSKGDQEDIAEYQHLKQDYVADLLDSGEAIPLGRKGEPSVRVPKISEPKVPE